MQKNHALSEDIQVVLAKADHSRDIKQWWDAAAGYRSYLESRPDQTAIWVQLGNVLKEAGDLTGASSAYQAALKLDNGQADTYLQLGHLLKVAGNLREAKAAYESSLSIDNNVNARFELAAMQSDSPAGLTKPASSEGVPAAAMLLFDCSDLMEYLRHNRILTGIQRVQVNVIVGLSENPEFQRDVVIVFCGLRSWQTIRMVDFRRLAAASQNTAEFDNSAWNGLRNHIANSSEVLIPTRNSILINIGTSWWIPDYFQKVRYLSEIYDIRYVPFIHDCIPLITPEYCAGGLIEQFSTWFEKTVRVADAIILNSDSTARDVRAIGSAFRGSLPPMQVVKLDGDMREHVTANELQTGSSLAAILDKHGVTFNQEGRGNYVLMVSTLEARKNHLLALRIWQHFLKTYTPGELPYLVCIGKKGWHFEEVSAFLKVHKELSEHVIFLSDITDEQLAAAYRGCLFTLYPSHYEGWGLPVTESLVFGRVPVVANNSSLPEAGGKWAVYFDPLAPRQAFEAVDRLLRNSSDRKQLEAMINASYKPRTWFEISQELAAWISGLKVGSPMAKQLMLEPVDCGLIYAVADTSSSHALGTCPGENLRVGLDWWPPEDWGTWSASPTAHIAAAIDGEGGPMRIYARIKAPPFHGGTAVQLKTPDGSESTHLLRPNEARWVVHTCNVDTAAHDKLLVSFAVEDMCNLADHSDGKDRRAVGMALVSVAFARSDRPNERVDIVEAIALGCG